MLNILKNIFNNIVDKYYYNKNVNIDKKYIFYINDNNLNNKKNVEYLFIETILKYINNLKKDYLIEIDYIIKINNNKLELEIINIKNNKYGK